MTTCFLVLLVALMVEFLTLFLGLVAGSQPVALAVSGHAASVELRLDGEIVAHLVAPPWATAVDLGRELRPHHLEALAFDRAGLLLDRTEQWVDLPRETAEARWAVEEEATTRYARLIWESVEHPQPLTIDARLDGRKVPLVESRLALPQDADSHVLGAEMAFPDGTVARADAVVGGGAQGQTAAELTTVAVEVRGRGVRHPREAEGLIWLGGEALPVLAVDQGPADLVVVADRSSLVELRRLRAGVVRRAGGRLRPRIELVDGVPRHQVELVGVDYGQPAVHAGARSGDRLFIVRPIAERMETGGSDYDLFGVSWPLPGADAGTAWQLTNTEVYDDDLTQDQRIADAVARAGLVAYAGGRPRSVVLLLGPQWRDASRFTAQEVRRFLELLRVPLRVWSVEAAFDELSPEDKKIVWEEKQARSSELLDGGTEILSAGDDLRRTAKAWGDVRELTTAADLINAASDLRREVDNQRILWVEGLYLPQQLEVTSGSKRVRDAD